MAVREVSQKRKPLKIGTMASSSSDKARKDEIEYIMAYADIDENIGIRVRRPDGRDTILSLDPVATVELVKGILENVGDAGIVSLIAWLITNHRRQSRHLSNVRLTMSRRI